VAESIDKAGGLRSSSVVAWTIGMLVAMCGLLPYALIGLAMRLVAARAFFLSGQAMIEGPEISLPTIAENLSFSVVLPVAIKDTTLRTFATQYAALPIPSATAAYLIGYAEFVLPICLAIGFATRFAALGLVVLTVLMSIYMMPEMFWTAHAYWIVILLALIGLGPGAISTDALIRSLYRR